MSIPCLIYIFAPLRKSSCYATDLHTIVLVYTAVYHTIFSMAKKIKFTNFEVS